MGKYVLRNSLWVMLVSSIVFGELNAITWNGNVVASVTDLDIEITGNVQLGNGAVPGQETVSINAINFDVTVSAVGGNRTITPNNDAGANSPVNLVITAAPGRTVTFDLSTNSLDFVGGNKTFLVTFTGLGNLVFNLGDNQHVGFIQGSVQGVGTVFLVGMNIGASTPSVNNVVFKVLNDKASNLDSTVHIGAASLIGFMGTQTNLNMATQQAIIAFNSSNNLANTGRLILQIDDTASMAVQGYLNNNIGGLYNISDIDFTTLAGAQGAFALITNNANTTWSGLLVLNQNNTLPNFRVNPWCLEDNEVGIQPGFVIGQNGQLYLNNGTYLDYVGGTNNQSPNPDIPADILERRASNGVSPQVNQVVKDRNPSALFVDGPVTFCGELITPQIVLDGASKIYFTSASGPYGFSTDPDGYTFTLNQNTVDAANNWQFTGLQGYGNILFDVEGVVDIFSGPISGPKAINILSYYENNTGGSVLINGTETNFKLREVPYPLDVNGIPFQYGKGAFLVNGSINIYDGINLQHTDEIHQIFEKNNPQQSEATYIGGESYLLCSDFNYRPTIAFFGTQENPSAFLFQTSLALTGVDIYVPNYGTLANNNAQDNFVNFVFFYNGYCVDQGTGRSLILGTNVGALASDLGTIVNRDAHFNVFVEADPGATQLVATILTQPNNSKVTQGAPANSADILNQNSVHSFFQAYATNVSIGTPAVPGGSATQAQDFCTQALFELLATSNLFVNGDFIAFETQGGIKNDPTTSVETGQGGIFVDKNGIFELANNARMSLATMVGIGFNGIVDINSRNISVHPNIGFTRSNLDLSDPTQLNIVPLGSNIPKFILDWKYTQANTCGNQPVYQPYAFNSVPAACQLPTVVAANITSIPSVQGTVDQFIIQNSRIGSEATVLVDGGTVNELLLMNNNDSGVAPTAILVVQNNATVGLGRSARYVDTIQAASVQGVNGLSIIANGDAQIRLNDNLLVNNSAAMLTGPNFGATGFNYLYMYSDIPREIRIQENSIWDLSQYNNANKNLFIGGNVSVVYEPKTAMALGGGNIVHVENSKIIAQPFFDLTFVGTNLSSSDEYRVRWGGTGSITMEENSSLIIDRGALIGIESLGLTEILNPIGQDQSPIIVADCPWITNLSLNLLDSAAVRIGSVPTYGGGLQIGNTVDQSVNNASVSFALNVNGPNAIFEIEAQGFYGLSAGIVNKPFTAPNTWTVAPLFNVAAITNTINLGIFKHSNILSGADADAALMAIGPTPAAAFTFNGFTTQNLVTAAVRGGANLALISGQTAPTILNQNGVISGLLSAGILSSRPGLEDSSKTVPAFPTTAATLFNYLAANAVNLQGRSTAQASKIGENNVLAGYIDTDGVTIKRYTDISVMNAINTAVDPSRSLQLGAVNLSLTSSGYPVFGILRN